ncbi:carbohydrate sulfotransferase 6-like [Engystomops pustulosus]|uniref:carbohydrate sulfotransferase 6-like n=1 Tax=Engystomops pustulosus TaxID=76066 RepID=UPI003AFA29BA
MSLRFRLSFLLLTTPFFLLYVSQFLSSKSSCSSSLSYIKSKPVHVIAVSSWRSGSSFLGQIFNHHKDVFYLFEPGHSVWMKLRDQSAELLAYPVRDLLRSLLTCDVSPLRHYLPKGGKHISEMKFFAESRALCSPPSCSAFIPFEGYDRESCFYRCVNSTLDEMAEACRRYTHIVMKTVRILDLSVLLPLLRDPELNLRIIHLVRDPRAVALSRKSFPLDIDNRIILKNENISKGMSSINEVMRKICKAQVAMNKLARVSLSGRYMVIRHEDLARFPVESIKQIYDFSELPLTEEMEQWMYNITHEEVRGVGQFMTFSRESSKVIGRWRTKADFNFIHQIQLLCKEAMSVFGYLPVRSKKEQGNMTLEIIKDEWSENERPPNHHRSPLSKDNGKNPT